MKRVANIRARAAVTAREAFQGSNMFAEWRGTEAEPAIGKPSTLRYVVYSYGTHFPMYIWEADRWYGNSDKYSRSTSKHQSQAHPPVPSSEIEWHDTDAMEQIARYGVAGWVARALGRAA